jgi:signal transduction histidine kinase
MSKKKNIPEIPADRSGTERTDSDAPNGNKQTQQELIEHNQMLTDAQALGRIGNFHYNVGNDTVTWSDELYHIMNVPIGEKLNFETAMVFYVEKDRDKLKQLSAESLKSGKGFEMEAAFIPRDGDSRRYLFIRTKSVDSQRIHGIVQDITERKEIEVKLKESAEKIKAKNRELELLNNELKAFTTIAAYDYEDTLRTLYTNLEFIITKEAKNMSDAGKANLRKSQRAIQKMKLLTSDIVALSRIEAPHAKPSKVDLNDVVKQVSGEMEDKIAAADAVINSEFLPTISGFPQLLKLLFFHLFDNALKFRDPSHKTKINIAYHHHVGRNHQPSHQICVIDNGIGFPPDENEKVFRMFYKAHERQFRGSGVGLSICRKIVVLHGGSIKIESEPGKGTTVRCFFPLT